MTNAGDRPITILLKAAADGDSAAARDLLPVVYDELRRLAAIRLANTPPGNTLQATALVHEAYLRLVGESDPGWDNRGHFFAAAAQAMRQILVDQYRRKAAVKHGGGRKRVDAEENDVAAPQADMDILALDEALVRLEEQDARKAKIVNLRYFAGLTAEETAAALGVSIGTIEREWRYIKRWLLTEMTK